MRIVFVTPYPPSLVHSRSYVFATQLAKRHPVTVVCLCRTPRDISDASKLRAHGIHVTPVFEEGRVGKLGAARAFLGDKPLEVARAKANKLREALWAEIERGDVGVVHVEHIHAAMIARNLPVPTIWDAVSCSARRVRLKNGGKSSRLRRAFAAGELRRMQTYERRLLRLFRHVVVSTEAELATVLDLRKNGESTEPAEPTSAKARSKEQPKKSVKTQPKAQVQAKATVKGRPTPRFADTSSRLRTLSRPSATLSAVISEDSTTHVLPAAIDVDYFVPSLARHHHNRLIFGGLLSEGQNRAALDTLMNSIMPRIWRTRPDVAVTIAGAEPPRWLEEINDGRVSVTGYVDDLRPYLVGSAIAVSPLPYVVGAPTTLLEAMATGVPVVASDAAAASLRAIPGADLLVAASPDRFAHLILRLLEDDALRQSLARNGRAYVERYHAAPLIARQLEALYTVVSGHSFDSPSIIPLRVAPATKRLAAAVGAR